MPTPSSLPTRTDSPEILTVLPKQANLQAEHDNEATAAAISPAPMRTGVSAYTPHPTEVRSFGIGTLKSVAEKEIMIHYKCGIAGMAPSMEHVAPSSPGTLRLRLRLVRRAPRDLCILTSMISTRPNIPAAPFIENNTAGRSSPSTRARYAPNLQRHALMFDAGTRQWVDATPAPSPSPPCYRHRKGGGPAETPAPFCCPAGGALRPVDSVWAAQRTNEPLPGVPVSIP